MWVMVSGKEEPGKGKPVMSLETRDIGRRVRQQLIHAGKMSGTLKISRGLISFLASPFPCLCIAHTCTHCLTEPLVRAYCMEVPGTDNVLGN